MNFSTILKSKDQSVLADSLSELLFTLCNPSLGASKSIDSEIAVATYSETFDFDQSLVDLLCNTRIIREV